MLLISGAGSISPEAARAAGASGFVSKDWRGPDVAAAVRMVGRGIERLRDPPERRRPPTLGARAGGALADGVAARPTGRSPTSLFLSPHTVKEHTSALYRKLGVRNRAEAVQRAERLKLTPTAPPAPPGISE